MPRQRLDYVRVEMYRRRKVRDLIRRYECELTFIVAALALVALTAALIYAAQYNLTPQVKRACKSTDQQIARMERLQEYEKHGEVVWVAQCRNY